VNYICGTASGKSKTFILKSHLGYKYIKRQLNVITHQILNYELLYPQQTKQTSSCIHLCIRCSLPHVWFG